MIHSVLKFLNFILAFWQPDNMTVGLTKEQSLFSADSSAESQELAVTAATAARRQQHSRVDTEDCSISSLSEMTV